jgi:hypothetical protein
MSGHAMLEAEHTFVLDQILSQNLDRDGDFYVVLRDTMRGSSLYESPSFDLGARR